MEPADTGKWRRGGGLVVMVGVVVVAVGAGGEGHQLKPGVRTEGEADTLVVAPRRLVK